MAAAVHSYTEGKRLAKERLNRERWTLYFVILMFKNILVLGFRIVEIWLFFLVRVLMSVCLFVFHLWHTPPLMGRKLWSSEQGTWLGVWSSIFSTVAGSLWPWARIFKSPVSGNQGLPNLMLPSWAILSSSAWDMSHLLMCISGYMAYFFTACHVMELYVTQALPWKNVTWNYMNEKACVVIQSCAYDSRFRITDSLYCLPVGRSYPLQSLWNAVCAPSVDDNAIYISAATDCYKLLPQGCLSLWMFTPDGVWWGRERPSAYAYCYSHSILG